MIADLTGLVSGFGYESPNHSWPHTEDQYGQLDYVCGFCLDTSLNGSWRDHVGDQSRNLSEVGNFSTISNLTAIDSDEDDEEGIDIELLLNGESTNRTEGWNETIACRISDNIDKTRFYRVILFPAALFMLMFSFLLKRRRLGLNCCGGRPGLVFPVNLIELQRHRFSYVAAFTFISWVMLDILLAPILEDVESGGLPFYPEEMAVLKNSRSFLVLVAGIQYAIVFYPVFASITSEHAFGYLIGSLYTWTLAMIFFLDKFICSENDTADDILRLASNAPALICLLYLGFSIPYRLISSCCRRCRGKKKLVSEQKILSHHEILYVKELVSRKKSPPALKWHQKIYTSTPSFKYSVSILTGATMGICFVFMACIIILKALYNLLETGKFIIRVVWVAAKEAAKNPQTADTNPLLILISEYTGFEPKDIKASYIKEVLDLWQIFECCIYLAMTIAFVSVVTSMVLTLRNYKTNTLLIYKGQQYEIPRMSDYSPYSLLLSAARYIGYQAAYATGGFVLQFFVLILLIVAVGTLLTLVFRYKMYGILMWLLNKFWVTVVVMISLLIIQKLMARFLFTLKNEKNESVLALDNRRFFFNFHYFAVFANTAIGFISCLVRVLKSVIFGLWIIPRLDMSTLNRHLEQFDAGFVSYVGLLYLENAHRNPTMLVAVHLFLQSSKDRSSKMFVVSEAAKKVVNSSRYKLVRNRWLTFYTLHKNPSLRFIRKKNVWCSSSVGTKGSGTKEAKQEEQLQEVKKGFKPGGLRPEPKEDRGVENTHKQTPTQETNEKRENQPECNGNQQQALAWRQQTAKEAISNKPIYYP